MAPKWLIRRYRKTWRGNSTVWVATAPEVQLVQEKVWLDNFLPSDSHKHFTTFNEAIAWATRNPRIVEVELPKVNRRWSQSWAMNHKDLSHDKGVTVNSGGTDVVIRTITGDATIHNKNLKPLAEHLLELHHETDMETARADALKILAARRYAEKENQ